MDRTFLTYNALDSACMLEIHNKFWPSLKEDGYEQAYNLTVDLFPVLQFMQEFGMKVDLGLLQETKKEVQEQIKSRQIDLDRLCGRPLNVNSSKDCITYFYGELNLPPITDKKSKKLTTNDLAMQRLARGTAKNPGVSQASLVQQVRKLQKLYSTYLNIQFDEDNRMRGSYNPRGSRFGRLSSSKTIRNTGMNFQNLPQEFKKFLVADEDYVLLEVDKRQAEWVVVAYLANDANMIQAIKEGVDVHAYTASLMFGMPIDFVKEENKLVGHTTNPEEIQRIRYAHPEIKDRIAGNWPRTMSLRQCGKKCLTGDTEVLTKDGWIRLDRWRGQDIAQWKNGEITFVPPADFASYQVEAEINVLEANHLQQKVTDEHRLLIVKDTDGRRRPESQVVTADAFTPKAHWHIPTSGRYSGVGRLSLTPEEMRLLVAIQADGTIDVYNNLVLRIAKERKKIQAEKLLSDLGLRFTRTASGFFIHNSNPEAVKIALLLGDKKLFGAYLLDSSYESLTAFIEEVVKWDGNIKSCQYFTTIEENAQWVQTISHLINRRATIHIRPNNGFGEKPICWVKLGSRNGTSLISVKKKRVAFSGKVYCPTVPSSFFLIRSGGKISVTGNSNHGLNYDEGYKNFALINSIEEREARRIVEMYHSIYPGIRIMYDAIKRQLQKDRTLTNCFGRKIFFMEDWCKDMWKSAYACLPQSTVVDCVNQAMIHMYHDEYLTKTCNINILAQVHDSILLEVPRTAALSPTEWPRIVDKIYTYLSPTLSYNGVSFIIKNDMKMGYNWGERTDTNKRGMRDIWAHSEVVKNFGSN